MEVFTMVVLIVFIACGTGVINEHFKTRRKELEHSSPNDDVYDEVEMLRERIEVLEKIVTDERYHLEREIDQLERRA
ncbi:MAG: hypothetical protein O7G86_08860 [Gammaproteobacteria bacterium]|nr:hypothetical protein [Gammaproteobacteria bacterium]MCZ6854017.1 hypothetical protein [Gammaproteobacteria bacterium]